MQNFILFNILNDFMFGIKQKCNMAKNYMLNLSHNILMINGIVSYNFPKIIILNN